ncbi:TetR/AcrR family transcriptional regulator [Antrihabitans stalactiti]|uniref:Helix-turn-helix transcriptional regulator n=1 Tax=Antrihabitans stalactiti TaxID=2584121 RepID=A0A848KLJ8_9NOCA|nr:TetR/AcrR family transcriptional regulator [Antrihabitans stalactiti]NMN99071.1 helix-turn-helix transcriptional regulator [Antrihabitans stalactiti]
MSEVKRSYDASRRREQAAARRHAVVEAALDLFEHNGFRSTSIAAIARHAGVSAESIYKVFGTKATLAKAVFDFVIAGDHEDATIADRPSAAAVAVEPDVRRKIEIYVQGLARRQQRSAKVQILIRDGRLIDDALDVVWCQLLHERLTGMTMLGRHLLDTGQLRVGIELDEVRDVLWTYVAVELYELLVLDRGWSLERYADWIAHAITTALT